MIAAKIVDRPLETACYYAYNYTEFECTDFEILTDLPSETYFWVETNYTLAAPRCYVNTQAYFGIGRATFGGETVVGKIHYDYNSVKTLVAPHGGKEHVIYSYEYLSEGSEDDKC